MGTRRLLTLKHERPDLGFLAARIVNEDGLDEAWRLCVESPADTDEFRGHLLNGSAMALFTVTRDGDQLRGEACVSSVSDGVDAPTVVTLAGLGPLQRG